MHNLLNSMKEDLTDTMGMAFKEWSEALREEIKDWRNGDSEPNWSGHRETVNEMCRDDGMPILFPSLQGPPARCFDENDVEVLPASEAPDTSKVTV